MFALGLVQGEWKMYVKWPLDREDRNLYTINVTASDGLFVSQATVEVTVIDTNDNSPICDQVGNKTSNCFFQRTDASMVSVKYVGKWLLALASYIYLTQLTVNVAIVNLS